jgi:hypothetical protein
MQKKFKSNLIRLLLGFESLTYQAKEVNGTFSGFKFRNFRPAFAYREVADIAKAEIDGIKSG